MKLEQHISLKEHAKDVLVVPFPKQQKMQVAKLKELDHLVNFKLTSEFKRRDFEWQAGQIVAIDTPANTKLRALVFFCWDDPKDEFKAINQYRILGATLFKRASALKVKTACLDCSLLDCGSTNFSLALLEGFELSNYSFDKYKKSKPRATVTLRLITKRKAITDQIVKKAQATCAATKLARDLVNLPPKDCTPRYLVSVAKQIAKKSHMKIEVFNEVALKKMGAGAILGVARGSSEPAFLIKLTYLPAKKARKAVTIVGKGVTFDSGGLSIKPGDGMMTMKIDMAGAAAVLGTMQAIASLKPALTVRAYLPVTENMINGEAQRPGDVVRAVNGKTIEVLNTDAEGRLILADALSLAERERPDTIIDLATLTGAVVIALGTDYAGLFSTSKKLSGSLQQAGLEAGERLWPLPLAEEYEPWIKSSIADIRNIGAGRNAGAITAALFLQNFVGNTEWAHIDMAGTAHSDKDSDYIPKGAVGFGVRTLVNYLMQFK